MGKAAEPLTISLVALQPARAAAMPVEMQMRLSELKSSQPTFHCDNYEGQHTISRTGASICVGGVLGKSRGVPTSGIAIALHLLIGLD